MAKEFVIEKAVFGWILKAAAGVLLLAGVAYPVDFAVWRVRREPMGSALVNRVVAAELKGNKEDYYFEGTDTVACSRSLYPQGGVNACWWQRRHPDAVVRY